jgi:hypothetical protein
VSDRKFSDYALLGEVRDWLTQAAQDGGATCPCCTQLTRVYRRPLNSAMTHGLIRAYRKAGREPFHMPTVLNHIAGDHAKLRYWGLIEEEPIRRPDGGRAGWWQITELGEEFVRRIKAVPKYALIFDGRLLRLDTSGGYVTVTQALRGKFDWAELMADVPPVYDATLLEANGG